MKDAVRLYLTGFGQVMLQNNALTGIIFITGLFACSSTMALGGLFGALSSVITAKLLKLKKEDIKDGLYGFNGALVGLALLATYRQGLACYILIAAASAISSVIMVLMLRWKDVLPPYTAPFIISSWGALFFGNIFGLNPADLQGVGFSGDFSAVLRGVGQVMFQDSWITGLLFVLALGVNSRQSAAWALIGAAAGIVCARGIGYPEHLTESGIFGFNCVLAGIALGEKYKNRTIIPLAGIVLSVFIVRCFQIAGITPFTAPFVIATWIVIYAEKIIPEKKRG